jgi:hypothetical protein
MKKLFSPYLLKFALAATVLTVVFRFCLSYSLNHEMVTMTYLSAVLNLLWLFTGVQLFFWSDFRRNTMDRL